MVMNTMANEHLSSTSGMVWSDKFGSDEHKMLLCIEWSWTKMNVERTEGVTGQKKICEDMCGIGKEQ